MNPFSKTNKPPTFPIQISSEIPTTRTSQEVSTHTEIKFPSKKRGNAHKKTKDTFGGRGTGIEGVEVAEFAKRRRWVIRNCSLTDRTNFVTETGVIHSYHCAHGCYWLIIFHYSSEGECFRS